MWTTIGFTEKLSVDFHHKGHIVLNHKTPLQQQFDNEYCHLKQRIGIYGAEQHQFLQLPPLVRMSLNEAIVDLVLLAALEQFEYQATNRLLLAALEEYEDSGTTQ